MIPRSQEEQQRALAWKTETPDWLLQSSWAQVQKAPWTWEEVREWRAQLHLKEHAVIRPPSEPDEVDVSAAFEPWKSTGKVGV
jgi:hypothetical protein